MKNLLASLFLFMIFTSSWAANLRTQQAHSDVELVTEEESFIKGKKNRVGLYFRLEPKWHTYWINPGDSGAALIANWNLPENYKVSGPFWPVPKRFEVSELQTFGFENQFLVYWEIDVPDGHLRADVDLKVKAEWLVCQEECLPATYEFSLIVPIQEISLPSKWHSEFSEARKNTPKIAWAAAIENLNGTKKITLEKVADRPLYETDFFPLMNVGIENSRPEFQLNGDSVSLQIESSPIESQQSRLGLLINRKPNGEEEAYWLEAKPAKATSLKMLLFAFLGGIILNLMPCVFPVLFLKAYGLIRVQNTKEMRRENLLYALGVVASMVAIGGTLLFLRAAGESVGWGFQLQSPWALSMLVILFFIMGLSFSGLFEVNLSQFAQIKSSSKYQPFFTGVLSTIVASPCTAPFMGASLGWALVTTPLTALFIFFFLGLGLAFPFLLIGYFPKIFNLLPKPGKWMETVKELMAIPLFATSIWLFSILKTTSEFSIWVLAICLLSYFIIWLGKIRPVFYILIALIPLITIWLFTGSQDAKNADSTNVAADQLVQTINESELAFFNFTADWCITCKVNERTTFSSDKVREFLQKNNIKFYKVDWTKKEPVIGEVLAGYQRAGVPFYLFVNAQKQKTVLPELLTPDILIEHLSKQFNTLDKEKK